MRGYKHMAVSCAHDVMMDPRVKPEDDGGWCFHIPSILRQVQDEARVRCYNPHPEVRSFSVASKDRGDEVLPAPFETPVNWLLRMRN